MPTAQELLSDPAFGLVREVRSSQIRMAASIQEVIENGGVYFVEGPVGLGKGYGYLTPSLLASGRRIVVATAKKQLQDQLELKDLPAIAAAIGPVEMTRLLTNEEGQRQMLVTVLKGKGNYACRLLAAKHPAGTEYAQFLSTSRFGDRADYQGSPPAWWSQATAEDCIGRGCRFSGECGYIRLKGNLTQSRVVIVNHHVLGADMYYGLGKMTGGAYDVLIVDEAHKLAEGIRAAFTVRVSENAITDIDQGLAKTSFKFNSPRRLVALWAEMFSALPNRHWRDAHLRDIPVFPAHADEATQGLEEIDKELATLLERYGVKGSPSDTSFWESLSEVSVPDDVRGELASIAQARRKVDAFMRGVRTLQGNVKPMDDEGPEAYQARKERILINTVAYGTADRKGFHVHCAPVNLGGIAKGYFSGIPAVVLTSATLAVGNSFTHLEDVVGVSPTKAEVLPPTFDYATQGFLYVPKDLPFRNRNAPDYIESVRARVDRAVRLVELSQGGAFVLTTANDELDEFGHRLKAAFPGRVFVQGHARTPWDGDPQTILQQYLKTPNSVLVGSKSFWEGVDVVGDRLRLVIIAKLPFPIFNDPIVKARERLAGAEAFHRVQMVDMLTDLRQGAGRLIRSKLDRGAVAILDSRVWEKPYGRQVRSALQFPITYDLADCEKYLPRFVQYFERLNQRGVNGSAP